MALNYVTFNQDYSHLAVGLFLLPALESLYANKLRTGTSNGFRIFHTEPFSKAHETNKGDITLLEMLFSTSLVAMVLSPRRLVITNTKVSRIPRRTGGTPRSATARTQTGTALASHTEECRH